MWLASVSASPHLFFSGKTCFQTVTSFLFFILLYGIVSSSFAFGERVPSADFPAEVYSIPSPEKALMTSPHFIVVDDFNTGLLNGRHGPVWRTKAPGMGALDIILDKQDSRQKRGYSLKVNFNLFPTEKASFQNFLRNLDVSQAEYLVFQCWLDLKEPADGSFGGKLQVALQDFKYREKTHEMVLSTGSGKWQAYSVPLSFFDGLDLNQLFLIRFTLLAGENKIAGSLGIDEIAFFGSGDVVFESRRDNLVGFPEKGLDSKRRQELARKKDRAFLKEIARDTWKYFQNARDKETHLLVDHLRVGEAPLAADYTSPTNIAMDLLATVSALDLKFISRSEAENRVRAVLSTLGKMKRYKKFFYNFYDTKKLSITRNYISTIDSGWLAIALVVVRQAFKNLSQEATRFLDEFSFDEFLDPETNQLVIGFEVPEKDFGKYHYGLLATEASTLSNLNLAVGNKGRYLERF